MRPAGDVLAGFMALPLGDVQTVLGGLRPLILAPHPDDESLGCGGLIAAACAAGLPPEVVILTDGSASHPGSQTYPPARLREVREEEARRALEILGLPPSHLTFLRYCDTRLPKEGDALDEAVTRLQSIAERGCKLVVAPWIADPHCDHEAAAVVAAALAEAARLRLLSYPVWGWLLDPEAPVAEMRQHGWRLDIGAQLDAKRSAIAAHASQCGMLIKDSVEAFCLPPELLAVFDKPYEVYIAG